MFINNSKTIYIMLLFLISAASADTAFSFSKTEWFAPKYTCQKSLNEASFDALKNEIEIVENRIHCKKMEIKGRSIANQAQERTKLERIKEYLCFLYAHLFQGPNEFMIEEEQKRHELLDEESRKRTVIAKDLDNAIFAIKYRDTALMLPEIREQLSRLPLGEAMMNHIRGIRSSNLEQERAVCLLISKLFSY